MSQLIKHNRQNSGVRLISNKNEGLISEKSMVLKCKNNNDKKSTM